MKSYIAFLRGINISGRNRIAMPELKAAFISAGYTNVMTYLNSGNVTFDADVCDEQHIRSAIETLILNDFGLEIPVYVTSRETLKNALEHAPEWWNTGDKDKYDNIIFILSEETAREIACMLGEPTDGLETAEEFDNIIFWTFDRKMYQKCSWWKKTASQGIAEKLTIRTGGTVRKMI